MKDMGRALMGSGLGTGKRRAQEAAEMAIIACVLKPGMRVSIMGDVVAGAWANNKAKVPTIVFGVTVK